MLGMGWPPNTAWPGGPEQGLSCGSPSLLHSNTGVADRYLGASRCGQAEPRNVPLGKAQPALPWRQVPAASSELGCQLSSSVLQGMRCLSTHGLPLGGVGLHALPPLGFRRCCLWLEVGRLCVLPRQRFASTAVGAGYEGADGYSKARPTCHPRSRWGLRSVGSWWLLAPHRLLATSQVNARSCSRFRGAWLRERLAALV